VYTRIRPLRVDSDVSETVKNRLNRTRQSREEENTIESYSQADGMTVDAIGRVFTVNETELVVLVTVRSNIERRPVLLWIQSNILTLHEQLRVLDLLPWSEYQH